MAMLLPVTTMAHEPLDGSRWPTAYELRRDLQDIGYEFRFDPSSRMFGSEFQPELPVAWRLTEPVIVDEASPADVDYPAFELLLADRDGAPVQLLWSAASSDRGAGELEAMATVLMEVAARLPEESGLEAAVWYMGNVWQSDDPAGRTALPCYLWEFPGGAMVVWSGAAGEMSNFFGTVAHFDVESQEVAQCRALQAQAAAAEPADEPAPDEGAPPATGEVDYTVAPADAVALIESGEHTVIDVRTPAEYAQAHVVGAINIDVEAPDFSERIAELDPDQPYLVYCRSGRRSALAAQQMAAAGFTDITDGAGLADLARAGAPIE